MVPSNLAAVAVAVNVAIDAAAAPPAERISDASGADVDAVVLAAEVAAADVDVDSLTWGQM